MWGLKLRQLIITGLFILGVGVPGAIAQMADIETEAAPQFVTTNYDEPGLTAPLPRWEYVQLLKQGIDNYVAAVDHESAEVYQRCAYLGSAVTLWQGQVNRFVAEAEAVMATLRASPNSSKVLKFPLTKPIEPVSLQASALTEAEQLERLQLNFNVELRSADGTFDGDRWVTRAAFLGYLNRILQTLWLVDGSSEGTRDFLTHNFQQLARLSDQLTSARQQLALLQSATQSQAVKALSSPPEATRLKNGEPYVLSDVDPHDPRYESAVEFMEWTGVDIRVAGDRLAPEQPLTQAQFLDDVQEFSAVLFFGSMPFEPMCDRFSLLDEDIAEIVQLQQQLEALEFEIRSLITAVNQRDSSSR